MFTILRALLSASFETPEQFLPKNTFCRALVSSPLLKPSLSAAIARGLGFGNYVVKRKRVASANNANGTAAGLSPRG